MPHPPVRAWACREAGRRATPGTPQQAPGSVTPQQDPGSVTPQDPGCAGVPGREQESISKDTPTSSWECRGACRGDGGHLQGLPNKLLGVQGRMEGGWKASPGTPQRDAGRVWPRRWGPLLCHSCHHGGAQNPRGWTRPEGVLVEGAPQGGRAGAGLACPARGGRWAPRSANTHTHTPLAAATCWRGRRPEAPPAPHHVGGG